eukprot:jgi/Tetstr1/466269/TSEL_000949.t1
MSGSGSPTDPPKMVDAGKAAAVECVETSATARDRINAGRRAAEDIHEQLSIFFVTQEAPMPPAAASKENAIPGGSESRAGATACVTDGVTPAFGQRLEDSGRRPPMEAVDDGHRFHLAYLRKQWDTQMYLRPRRRAGYLRLGTENLGNRDNFKNTRQGREAAAPRATLTKDVSKDWGIKGKTRAEAPVANKAE